MAERQKKIAALRLDGRKVEDLYLDFTLPGFADWELKVINPFRFVRRLVVGYANCVGPLTATRI